MDKPILVVQTQPVSVEREDEYNDWYTNQHLDDVLKVNGFCAAKRYEFSGVTSRVDGQLPELQYLAIYEMDTDDVDAVAENLRAAVAAGMFVSDAMDKVAVRSDFYVPIPDAEASV